MTSEQNQEEEYIEKTEEDKFSQLALLSEEQSRKIEKMTLKLSNTDGFEQSFINRIFKRNNYVQYGIYILEEPISLKASNEQIPMRIMNNEQIRKTLKKCRHPEKMQYIHFGTIKVAIKANYTERIDSPVLISIRDGRFKNAEDGILGIVQGNLYFKQLQMNIHPKFHMSLKDAGKDLIVVDCDFSRKDLFSHEDYYPYNLVYCISFALTNSCYSLNFANQETIQINEIFKKAGNTIKKPERTIGKFPANFQIEYKDPRRKSISSNEDFVIKGNKLTLRSCSLREAGTSSQPKRYVERLEGPSIFRIQVLIEGKPYKPLIDTGASYNHIKMELAHSIKTAKWEQLIDPIVYTNYFGNKIKCTLQVTLDIDFMHFRQEVTFICCPEQDGSHNLILGNQWITDNQAIIFPNKLQIKGYTLTREEF